MPMDPEIEQRMQIPFDHCLARTRSYLTASTRLQVEEFVDNRQYGLALETLAEGILQASNPLDVEVAKNILHFPIDMEIFDDISINNIYLELSKQLTRDKSILNTEAII